MKIEIKLSEQDKHDALKEWIANKYPELLKSGKIVNIYPALGEVLIYIGDEYGTESI